MASCTSDGRSVSLREALELASPPPAPPPPLPPQSPPNAWLGRHALYKTTVSTSRKSPGTAAAPAAATAATVSHRAKPAAAGPAAAARAGTSSATQPRYRSAMLAGSRARGGAGGQARAGDGPASTKGIGEPEAPSTASATTGNECVIAAAAVNKFSSRFVGEGAETAVRTCAGAAPPGGKQNTVGEEREMEVGALGGDSNTSGMSSGPPSMESGIACSRGSEAAVNLALPSVPAEEATLNAPVRQVKMEAVERASRSGSLSSALEGQTKQERHTNAAVLTDSNAKMSSTAGGGGGGRGRARNNAQRRNGMGFAGTQSAATTQAVCPDADASNIGVGAAASANVADVPAASCDTTRKASLATVPAAPGNATNESAKIPEGKGAVVDTRTTEHPQHDHVFFVAPEEVALEAAPTSVAPALSAEGSETTLEPTAPQATALAVPGAATTNSESRIATTNARSARKRRKSAESGWRSRYSTEEFESGDAILSPSEELSDGVGGGSGGSSGSSGGGWEGGRHMPAEWRANMGGAEESEGGKKEEEDDEDFSEQVEVDVGGEHPGTYNGPVFSGQGTECRYDGYDDGASGGNNSCSGGEQDRGSVAGRGGGGSEERGAGVKRRTPNKKRDPPNAWKKRCQDGDCQLGASFGYNGKPAIYCSAHKDAGMINVTHRRCEEPG